MKGLEKMKKDKNKAKVEYYRRTTKQFKVQFRNEADSDIIEKMNSVPSKTDYLRKLIKKDIEESKEK